MNFCTPWSFLNDRSMFTMPIKINTIFNDPSPRPNVVMAASTDHDHPDDRPVLGLRALP